MDHASNLDTAISRLEGATLASAVITGAMLVGSVLWYCGYGYDFSDEGHYLNCIARPWVNQTSVTQFGFVYHPLYHLVRGDVAMLRRASTLLTLGLGWLLCIVLLRKLVAEPGGTDWRRHVPLAGVAFVLCTATLASLHSAWLPSPSYDSLTLQALLVAGIGILVADSSSARGSRIGWVLIGISGWLAFMAKPTSAMALGVAVGFYLILSGKINLRMLGYAMAIAVGLGVVSAWLIDGSIAEFAIRLISGAEDAALMQGRHTLDEALRLDEFSLSPPERNMLRAATVLVPLATCLCFSARVGRRALGAVLTLLATAALWVIGDGLGLKPDPAQFHGLQYWAVPYGALLTTLVVGRHHLFRHASRDHWAAAAFFLILPWVYAFGTNQNYWVAESKAAIFWVLAGIILLRPAQSQPLSWRMLMPAAAGAQLCTGVLLFASMEHPYRQTQALHLHDRIVLLGGTRSELRVSADFAEYVQKLQQLAATAGFKANMNVLDLTGHYPGALYALGAKNVGRSWLIGGYPGSDDMAVANLDRVNREDLASAWILSEPTGPRKLSPKILKRYGIDLAKDYIEVGSLESPTGSYPDRYRQHLLRPRERR